MRVLVVDDEFASRTKMHAIIGKIGECAMAESGPDALVEFTHAWAIGLPYDLIMLDIDMPFLSGIQVLRKIRNIEKGMDVDQKQKTKIIMVTSHSDQKNVIESLNSGCDNFIIKPFDFERVVEKLKAVGIEVQTE
jgi:DNA-binding response OmpR family regulator